MTKINVMNEMSLNDNTSDNGLTRSGLKRMSKPMMEKRRRARINRCLTQLKEMVIDSGKQNVQVCHHNYHDTLP